MSLKLFPRKSILSNPGFTLIEVMISITVFAIGILAIASMQTSAISGNSSANRLSAAATLAQDKLEELIALSYDDNSLNDTNTDSTAGLNDTEENADYVEQRQIVVSTGTYNVSWNVAMNEPVVDSKTIRVIVSWQQGRTRRVAMTVVKSRI
jgi:type IV pilus assembly protein PilV